MENADQNMGTIEKLLGQLEEEPNSWGTRKKVALMLYEAERYLEAADALWNAPEMPATDVDVAFSIKIVSRARPNRSIRLIYEVLRRNEGKPMKNKAVARALNMIGMPMLAARFYGAAAAEDAELFDLSFEKQSLWFDDSGSLLDQWKATDQEAKPPLSVPLQDFAGDVIELKDIAEHAGEDGEDVKDEGVSDASAPAIVSVPAPSSAPAVPAAPAVPSAPAAPVIAAGAPKVTNPTTPLIMPKPLAGVRPATGAEPGPPKPRLNVGTGAAVRTAEGAPVVNKPTLLRPGAPKLPKIEGEE